MKDFSEFSPLIIEAAKIAEERCKDAFARIDNICEHNTRKTV